MFSKQRITTYSGGFLLSLELGCRQHSRPRFKEKPKGIGELLGHGSSPPQHPGVRLAPAKVASHSSPKWANPEGLGTVSGALLALKLLKEGAK